jgi:hypothetical protein
MLGKKGKDKGKGFEVVRSSRMPPAMRATGGDFDDETPPEGIPVAMGVLRNGPIDSDDEDEGRRNQADPPKPVTSPEQEPLNSGRMSREDSVDGSGIANTPPTLALPSDIGAGRGIMDTSGAPNAVVDGDDLQVPDVPRKSSKRLSWTNPQTGETQHHPPDAARSANLTPSAATPSRLPFERTPSQRRLSGSSAGLTDEFIQVDLQDSNGRGEERTTGYGFVNRGSISKVNHEVDLLGSSAEVVDDRR